MRKPQIFDETGVVLVERVARKPLLPACLLAKPRYRGWIKVIQHDPGIRHPVPAPAGLPEQEAVEGEVLSFAHWASSGIRGSRHAENLTRRRWSPGRGSRHPTHLPLTHPQLENGGRPSDLVPMAAVKRRQLEVASRRVVQDAKLAIRDVYDAIVELVTNSDDRYQILGTSGRVEIELGRRGRGQSSILRVRDFADGMTTGQMNRRSRPRWWPGA